MVTYMIAVGNPEECVEINVAEKRLAAGDLLVRAVDVMIVHKRPVANDRRYIWMAVL